MSARSPLDGIDLVLIDGNNLLHRQRQGAGDAAARGVLVTLRRVLPAAVRAVFLLDGHAEPGTPMRERISPTLDVRPSGSHTADDAIVSEINDLPWAARGRTIVVTDDRALADRSRTAGALTRRLEWLTALPTAPAAGPTKRQPTIGARKPRW